MSTELDYKELREKQQELEKRLAVLQEKEREKKVRREQFLKELVEEGVDIKNLEQEETRLRQEIEQDLQQARERITQFEKEINQAEGK